MKKSKKITKKVKRKAKGRLVLAFVFFSILLSSLGYNLILNIITIKNINQEKLEIKNKIALLEKEENVLESDIQKLKDPAYVARYAREKYLYSKEGEIIIRIPD